MALVAALTAFGLVVVPAALGSTLFQDIHSSGPLSDIYVGQDLSCQVAHAGISRSEFFPGAADLGDCGTFLGITGDGTQQLFGPDFPNHAASSATGFSSDYLVYNEVSQTPVTGSGTQASPYTVTTVVTATDPTLSVTLTQVDSYVVGNDFYQSNLTVQNSSTSSFSGQIFHAGDCFLRGFDSGFGALEPSANTAACTINQNNSPASALEEFVPVSPAGNHYVETSFGTIWGAVDAHSDLPDTCDCTTNEDNAMGIDWPISLAINQSASFSWQTKIDDPAISVTGGRTFSGPAPLSVNGTVATITDSDTSTTPSSYTATVNWGDGTSDQNATIAGSNGSFTVADQHTYPTPGPYTITVTAGYANNAASDVSANDAATVQAAPGAVATGAAHPTSSKSAQLTGSGNPNGLPTTGHWIYGLDASERGPGFSGNIYDQSTPSLSLGSDYSSHAISAVVSNLMPNARYHARFVAVNSAGTTIGPDQVFTTPKAPVPPPVLGKENFTPIGTVFVLENGKFVKLTQTLQLPSGTEVDALHGSLVLVTASGGSGKASDAKTKKAKKAVTYTGTFGGAVFKVTQTKAGADKGLTTLSIVEGAFKGAPTYASCKAKGAADGSPVAQAALSSRILQTLRSRSRGRYRTRGRYAAGTVRGTQWTTTDRCDGTLIKVQQHSVLVTDLVKHINVLVTAGHSYLAKAHK